MKERPILFSGEMVRAILGGRKTQTRRLNGLAEINKNPDQWRFDGFDGKYAVFDSGYDVLKIKCPYGEIGDRLWVRETWCFDGFDVIYKATHDCDIKWKPSIFMPRWASRVNLEITNRRLERLQDITEKDAQAEGMDPYNYYYDNTINEFKHLWKTINGSESWDINPWVRVVEFKKIN